MALLLISYPISIVEDILEVRVLSQTVFLSVHPLSIIYFLLFHLRSSWFPQQHSHSVLLVLLELSAVLHVLLVEVVNSVAFDPLATPGADVHISVGEGVLFLNQFSTCAVFIVLIIGSCLCSDWWLDVPNIPF